jgi:teichuronic acid biosynthesis glycosyltransferase TuaC
MKLLVVVFNYPHPGHRFSGIFNERSVEALKHHCELVTVLAPRPYVPSLLNKICVTERWRAYAEANSFELRNGVPVHRPAYVQVPRLASSFWEDRMSYICAWRTARKLHTRYNFDAILSFGLDGSGGLAWRLSRRLGIPVAVWATGSDIRKPQGTAAHKAIARTLSNSDLVIYQSRELLEIGAGITKGSRHSMSSGKHIVLPRGIAEPPFLAKDEVRKRERVALRIAADEILVLFIGRVTRFKGIFELLEAMVVATARNPKIKCRIIGSKPAFDETASVEKRLNETPDLRKHVTVLPACDPEKIWEYLCAADIFAFPSHNEGMPNSLLEAMAMGVSSVAFAIPAVKELEAGTGAVTFVPPLNSWLFAEAILRLAESPDERARVADRGREQVMNRFMVQTNMGLACAYLAKIIEERADKVSTREAVVKNTQADSVFANFETRD